MHVFIFDKCGLEYEHAGDKVSDEKDDEAEEEETIEGVRQL
jgi:hypothetical protein